MEIFASLKTMNKPITQLRVFVAVAAMLSAALLAPHAQAQSSGDKISVNLSDPARPAFVKVSMVNGSIIVKGYDGRSSWKLAIATGKGNPAPAALSGSIFLRPA